jgi:hypothetical protein
MPGPNVSSDRHPTGSPTLSSLQWTTPIVGRGAFGNSLDLIMKNAQAPSRVSAL